MSKASGYLVEVQSLARREVIEGSEQASQKSGAGKQARGIVIVADVGQGGEGASEAGAGLLTCASGEDARRSRVSEPSLHGYFECAPSSHRASLVSEVHEIMCKRHEASITTRYLDSQEVELNPFVSYATRRGTTRRRYRRGRQNTFANFAITTSTRSRRTLENWGMT